MDPCRDYVDIARNSYPPTLLGVYAILAPMPYKAQRLAWIVLEWLALLASVALLARIIRRPDQRLLFVTVAILFFAGGNFWRLHVERGQYYVFVVLLWSVALYRCMNKKTDGILAGLLIGLAASLRPTGLVALAPLWMLGLRRTALAMLLGVGLAVAATMPLSGIRGWQDYVRMVELLGQQTAHPGALDAFGGGPTPPPPPVIEGCTNLRNPMTTETANVALPAVLARLGEKWPAFTSAIAGVANKIACAAMLAVFGVAMLVTRRRGYGPRYVMAISIAMVLAIDYFVPIRCGYADVLFLLPIALLMPGLMHRAYAPSLLLVMLGLVVGYVAAMTGHAGTWLRNMMVMAGLACYLLVAWRRRTFRRGTAAIEPPDMQ